MATFETPPTPGTGFPSIPKNLVGTSASEKFATGSGNDTFDGGAGTDTVTFSGTRAEHSIVKSGTGWTVSSTADGTDTLQNVERLQFSDSSLAFDLTSPSSAGGIYRLYGAAFNRVPDLGGVGYWISKADNGLSAADMALKFIYEKEFKDLYGITNIVNEYDVGVNVTNLINGFYQNMLRRNSDPDGLAFYVGKIAAHEKTIGQVLAEISDSKEYADLLTLTGVMANGIAYTPWLG